jgi:hypothetical protein
MKWASLDDDLLVENRNADVFAGPNVVERPPQILSVELLADRRRPGRPGRARVALPPRLPELVIVAFAFNEELLHPHGAEARYDEVLVFALTLGTLERDEHMRITAQVEQLSIELDIKVNGLHGRGIDDEILDLANRPTIGIENVPSPRVPVMSFDSVTAEA